MGRKRKLKWTEYRKRRCYSMHHCDICGKTIYSGEEYYDGGYGKRAHISCAEKAEK